MTKNQFEIVEDHCTLVFRTLFAHQQMCNNPTCSMHTTLRNLYDEWKQREDETAFLVFQAFRLAHNYGESV